MEAVIDLSTTFILGLADRLMDADFALCLGYLQSIECHMPSVVIAAAASLQEKRLTAPLTQHQQTAAVSNPLKQSLRDRLRAAAEGAAKQYASFSETDAAASLQKSATNWGIAALSLRDSIGTADRQDLTKRVQDLGSSLNRRVRPTSPNLDQPFQPPASPLHNESSPPTKYTSKLFNSRSSDSFDAPPSTPRTRPLLLGSSIRPSGSHSSLTPSFGSPADSRLGKSPMLSPSPKTHGRRTSSVSGGGLLGYVPSPGPSPSHPKFSHMTYRPSSPRTLMDSMPITENSLSGRSRQTSEPISPSASYQRLHQLTHADGDDPLRMSDQSADSSISPTISEEQVAASRRHAKRFSIPTRTIRSDSLADSFNPLTDQPSTSRQPQSAKPVFGLGIAETKDGLAPLQENEIASSPILQPPPKRKTKISSSRRRNQGSISSRASSTYSADTDSMSIRDEIDDGDAQEVLLPNKNNSSLSPATAKTADTGANSPGYDGIFDSYR